MAGSDLFAFSNKFKLEKITVAKYDNLAHLAEGAT